MVFYTIYGKSIYENINRKKLLTLEFGTEYSSNKENRIEFLIMKQTIRDVGITNQWKGSLIIKF